MKLMLRVTGNNNAVMDLMIQNLDVSNIPAAVKGQATPLEVLKAIEGRLFDGTVFPLNSAT